MNLNEDQNIAFGPEEAPITEQPQFNGPETIQELKEELLGKIKEADIAYSMANYKSQEALDKAQDIKSNKKLIIHFKKLIQYQLGIIQALGEHAKGSINIAVGMVDIVSSKDPRLREENLETSSPVEQETSETV